MDLYSLFQAFINSDTVTGMYKGIAYFIDNPNKLYYILYQSSSIRIIFGEYIYFLTGTDVSKTIFPLDFMYFKCFDIEYNRYLYSLLEENDNCILYIGRVKCIGKNYISDYTDYSSKIIIIVQECLTINKVDNEFPGLGIRV